MDDASNPVVKLEIDTEWYWWSGYQRTKPSGYSFRGLLAATDGPEFYTPAAFPALKPDIDTFGIPRRSRKQRGWYHVLVAVSPSPFPFRRLRDGRVSERERLEIEQRANRRWRAAAKPSDIPPELFDNVLAHLTAHRVHGRADKPLLARCSLVCRYWAAKCQPVLFEKVALRGREDALQLLALMRTPGSAVPGLVTGVYVREALQVGGPAMPWLHLVAAIGDRAHRGLSEFSVKLKGPLPLSPGSGSGPGPGPTPGPGPGHDGQQTGTRTPRLRSIHHGLPRSLPPHFSRLIGKLVLLDLNFAALADLAHLVRELPALWRLFCERVTWPEASLPEPAVPVILQGAGAGAALHGHGILHGHLLHRITRRKPRNRSVYAQSVRMSQCGPRAVEASVWVVASMRPRDGAFCDADDFARVVLLAREMGEGASAGVGASLHADHLDLELGQDRRVCLFDTRHSSFSSNSQPPSPSSSASQPHWHIDTAVFDMRKSQIPEPAGKPGPDWTAVDTTLSSFPALTRAIIGLGSRDDMMRFHEEVAEVRMPRLVGSGRLKYALWGRWEGKEAWVRAAPYVDDADAESYGCWHLHKVYDE